MGDLSCIYEDDFKRALRVGSKESVDNAMQAMLDREIPIPPELMKEYLSRKGKGHKGNTEKWIPAHDFDKLVDSYEVMMQLRFIHFEAKHGEKGKLMEQLADKCSKTVKALEKMKLEYRSAWDIEDEAGNE